MGSISDDAPFEILVVQNDLGDARTTFAALAGWTQRHRLTLVRNCDEARLFLNRGGIFARAPRPDCVLLDTVFPNCRGDGLLRTLKQHDRWARIPVFVMGDATCWWDSAIPSRLADGYLSKPLDLSVLLNLFRGFLNSQLPKARRDSDDTLGRCDICAT